jgi:hypothetical protein
VRNQHYCAVCNVVGGDHLVRGFQHGQRSSQASSSFSETFTFSPLGCLNLAPHITVVHCVKHQAFAVRANQDKLLFARGLQFGNRNTAGFAIASAKMR